MGEIFIQKEREAKMNKGRIVATVVTYNRKELLNECIMSLLSQTIDNIDILVIDNNSNDGTYESLKHFIGEKSIKYFNTGKNLGGAGGFNIGVKKAYEMGYEYIWIMDDDTIPFPDCAEKLMAASQLLNEQYGFLSSYAEWTDGSPCIMNIQTVSPIWIENNDHIKDGLLSVTYASFVSLFIRRNAIQKCGLPIKEFFIWGDDAEFTRRLSKKYDCFFVYDSRVTHKMKDNVWVDISNEDSDRVNRFYYLYRNRMYISRKEGKSNAVKNFGHNMTDVIKVIRNKKPKKAKKIGIILKGTISGIFFNPKIEMAD